MARLDELAARFVWIAHITIVLGLLAVAWMAMDRAPPFRVLPSPAQYVDRGEFATFSVQVERQVHRWCSAEYARYIFAADGARYDIGTGYASPEMIADMERRHPGRLIIAVQIPETMVSGPARLSTELQYQCNKVHAIWPIRVRTEIPFIVR
jgi:hypothetical protein